jgi:long-chain acyl-CoA synthetase
VKGVGEIEVKGPSVMLGYYEQPEETARVFTADGYFRTGDLGYIDRDGFVHIRGR